MISFYSECTVNCNSNLFSAQCHLMSMVVPELAWETATTFQHSLFPCCLVAKSCPTLVTPWTLAHWAPLSVGFPGQEYWSVLPFPAPGDLPDPGIKPVSPALAGTFFTTEPPGRPLFIPLGCFIFLLSLFSAWDKYVFVLSSFPRVEAPWALELGWFCSLLWPQC